MILSDCHTHTKYCDGKNTAEEMILSAIEKGFSSIGISSHSPVTGGLDWCMNKNDVDSYIDEIRSLQKKYEGKIQVYCGIELDNNFEGIDLEKFDYSLGSVHQFRHGGKIYDVDYSPEMTKALTDEIFGGDYNKMAKAYFEKLRDFVISTDVDVVGHFDLITKYNENDRLFDTKNAAYRKCALNAIDEILKAKPDIIFEVNTGAMFRCGNSQPYPSYFILEYLFKRGARITVTGDCHSCQSLTYGYDSAVSLCKKAGFEKAYVLLNGSFTQVDL